MKKTILLPALAVVAASVAMPAAAQSLRSYENQAARISQQIMIGERQGRLHRGEANRLRAELNQTVRLQRAYARNGLDRRERAELNHRYQRLEANVQYAMRANYRYRYGQNRW